MFSASILNVIHSCYQTCDIFSIIAALLQNGNSTDRELRNMNRSRLLYSRHMAVRAIRIERQSRTCVCPHNVALKAATKTSLKRAGDRKSTIDKSERERGCGRKTWRALASYRVEEVGKHTRVRDFSCNVLEASGLSHARRVLL